MRLNLLKCDHATSPDEKLKAGDVVMLIDYPILAEKGGDRRFSTPSAKRSP
jgi:hypothetical protein